MSKVKVIIRWCVRNFFQLSILGLLIVYLWWFWVHPISKLSWDINTDAYLFGFVLIFLYLIVLLLCNLVRKIALLGKMLNGVAWIVLFINILYIVLYIPQIVDIAIYNKTIYQIVVSHPFPEPMSSDYGITKWWGLLNYSENGLGIGTPTGHLQFFYDKTINKVNVLDVFLNSKVLVYTDDENNPLFYEMNTEFDGYRYYLAYQCKKWNTDCDTLIYSVYKCEMNNTKCSPLPFHYITDYVFDMSVEQEGSVHITAVYFNIDHYLGNRTLIFTDGDNPHCYIKSCEILPKQK